MQTARRTINPKYRVAALLENYIGLDIQKAMYITTFDNNIHLKRNYDISIRFQITIFILFGQYIDLSSENVNNYNIIKLKC